MSIFNHYKKIYRLLLVLIFALGVLLGLISVASPFLGLGEKEGFVLYRLAEVSRTQAAVLGAILILVGLAGLLARPAALFVGRHPLGAEQGWIQRRLVRLVSFFSFPIPRSKASFNRKDQAFLLVAALIFQTVYLFIIPLAFECDAVVYFSYAKSLVGDQAFGFTYRPPGFPVFLIATGQLAFGSFVGTVIAHAAMGVLAPVLVYRSLAPLNRFAALICAGAFILSTVPFTAAKLMLATQLIMFLVLATVYGFSRYYFSRDPRFIYMAIFLGFAAMFTRWEAQFLLLFAAIALFIMVWRKTGHLRHLMLALSVVATATVSYSYLRSYVAREPALFGSLHNGTGQQMFWRVYTNLPKSVLARGYRLGERLVDPSNGPATRQLRQLIVQSATENPEAYRNVEAALDQAYQPPGQPRRDLYQEAFGRFDGDPEALADNFFENPNNFYPNYVFGALRKKLGIRGADVLLQKVELEALYAHPETLLVMIDQGMSLFGFSTSTFTKLLQGEAFTNNIPVFRYWSRFHYANVLFDVGGCASKTLPQTMMSEYRWDQSLSDVRPHDEFVTLASNLRNLVRNTGGALALLTWWFLPFSRHRIFLVTLAAATLSVVGVTGVAGGGAYTRYENTILPLILIVTTGGVLTVFHIAWNLYGKKRGVDKGVGGNARVS